MTNAEKYKSAKERAEAFSEWCKGRTCSAWPCKKCAFDWLDLEAPAEDPLPCPFCGGPAAKCVRESNGLYRVKCAYSDCWYSSDIRTTEEEAIAAHNRVARAVMDAKAKEAK